MKFLRRHSEALLIVGFIWLDLTQRYDGLLSTLALIALTLLAIPAVYELFKISDGLGRISYLKAWVKTPRMQRFGLLCFWLIGVRWLLACVADANLFTVEPDAQPFSLSTAFLFGARQFAPVWYLGTPFVAYAGASVCSIFLRSRLKVTKQDLDLVMARQWWCGVSQALFFAAFVGGILSITMNPHGPAMMVSNWLLASARDANLWSADEVTAAAAPSWTPSPSGEFDDHILPSAPMLYAASDPIANPGLSFLPAFDAFIIGAMSLIAFVFLLQPALKLNALLTSFCWRVVSGSSLQNLIEAFLQALHLPKRTLQFRERFPFWGNALRTVAWLVACYAGLWWLFGFFGAPLGTAFQNWFMASAADAGLAPTVDPPSWLWSDQYRIFAASIVALYGTAPVAVTAAVFLPFAKGRQIVLDSDGLLFSRGPYLSLFGRQFRLWSDLKTMTVETKGRCCQFRLRFRSGGIVSIDQNQVSAQDLRVLLDNIDEHASMCEVDSEVFSVVEKLLDERAQEGDSGVSSDGIAGSAISGAAPPEQFKSTIFVPFVSGELIPGTQMRIIKHLASKPLCAVYLAREENGRMVTVKQFYLAEDNAETQALSKTLRREYELLSRLDHPGIAKVVNSFVEGKSTYLVVEFRLGNDLREVVTNHGPRSESCVIAWAKQICQIMIYLHGQQPPILHRDLTPDNVIAGEDGQLRLIDFGAAREFLDGITGTMIGKHCYVPPEQLQGDATTRSDIYSFGATLYFLLTGRDPIALSQSSPRKTLDCSEEIDQLIRDCTSFNQQDRPASVEAVMERLVDIECLGGPGAWLKIPTGSKKRKQEVVA